MALRLQKRKFELRSLKPALITCAVIVGAGVLIVNTFPHVKTTLYQYLHGGVAEEEEDGEDEEEEEGGGSLSGETVIVESIHRDPNNENRTIDSFQVVRWRKGLNKRKEGGDGFVFWVLWNEERGQQYGGQSMEDKVQSTSAIKAND